MANIVTGQEGDFQDYQGAFRAQGGVILPVRTDAPDTWPAGIADGELAFYLNIGGTPPGKITLYTWNESRGKWGPVAATLDQVLSAGKESDKEFLLQASGENFERIVKLNYNDLLFYIRGLKDGVEQAARFQALPGEAKWAVQKGDQIGQIILYPDQAVLAVDKIIFERSGGTQASFLLNLLTGNRTYNLPNQDGTLLLDAQKGAANGVGSLDANGKQPAAQAYLGVNRKAISSGYTVQPSDLGKLLVYSGSGDSTITFPPGLGDTAATTENGFGCVFIAVGTGRLTAVASTGATLTNPDEFYRTRRNWPVSVMGVGSSTYNLIGTVL